MARANLGVLLTKFRTLTNDPKDSIIFGPDKIILLNSALQDMSNSVMAIYPRFYLTQYSFSSVVGENTVALPDDCSEKISGLNKVGYEGGYGNMQIGDIADFDQGADNTGSPDLYDIVGDYIYFNRYPDTAEDFNLFYYRLPANMEEETDYPDFPKGCELLLVYSVIRTSKLPVNDTIDSIHVLYTDAFRKMEKILSRGKQDREIPRVKRVIPSRTGNTWINVSGRL